MRRHERPPGGHGLPVLGHNLQFVTDSTGFVQRRARRLGPIFRAHLFGRPVVFLGSAGAIEWALRNEGETVQNEWLGNVPMLLGPNSTAMLTGVEHKERRRLLAPHFSARGLESMIPRFEGVIADHLDAWIDAREIQLSEAFRALTFELISRYALGDLELLPCSLTELSRHFSTFVDGLFSLPVSLPGSKLSRARRARERLESVLRETVAHRRRRGDPEEGEDALSSLLRVGDGDSALDDAAIAEELVLLLFAGHETTVTTMTNWAVLMAEHPVALSHVVEEQRAHPDNTSQIGRRRFTQATFQETNRLYTPIGSSFRRVLEDTEVGGYRVEAGETLALSFPLVHLDDELYERPRRFEPARMLPPREEHRRHPFAYAPFGGGPRLCLGMHLARLEMHLIAHAMVTKSSWALVPGQNLARKALPTPLPQSGGRVRIMPAGSR